LLRLDKQIIAFATASVLLVALTTWYGGDHSQTFIAGVGAFGQVGIAWMLYRLTREQYQLSRQQFAHEQNTTQAQTQRELDREHRARWQECNHLLDACERFLRSDDPDGDSEDIAALCRPVKGRYSDAVNADCRAVEEIAHRLARAGPEVNQAKLRVQFSAIIRRLGDRVKEELFFERSVGG
jgi:hypothetical protein